MYNILVVDDERIERDTIKFLIKKYSYDLNIVEATNGEKAFEYILNNSVDILFTDIKMPFMDGMQLCEKVMKIKPEIKIIIFSAYGEFQYAKKAIKLGVTEYILKPLDVGEFQAVLTKIINKCLDEEKRRKKYEKEDLIYDVIDISTKNLIKNVHEYILKKDYYSVERCIDLLNDNIKTQTDISASFVRLTYSDILRKLYESNLKYDEDQLSLEIATIYDSYIITDIIDIIKDKIIKLKNNNSRGILCSTQRAIEEVINLIHNDYSSELSVEALAEKVYFTPNYLSYVFKKQIGVGIVKYITSYRLEIAKELIQSTNMKIVDICKKVGYSNESYFSMNFKNHFGVSPSKCRE